jgi:hypothetical protein
MDFVQQEEAGYEILHIVTRVVAEEAVSRPPAIHRNKFQYDIRTQRCGYARKEELPFRIWAPVSMRA